MADLGKTAVKRVRVPDPVVIPSYKVRGLISFLFSPTFFQMLPDLIPNPISYFRPPKWLRNFLLLLIFLNIKSFPLIWHFRMFYPAIKARAVARPSIHPLLPWFKSNRFAITRTEPRLKLSSLPLGKDIFEDVLVKKFFSSFDDSDWNGHLSNSSYAKNVDYARMEFLTSRFLRMHFDGGWLALGGSSYQFHKELPALTNYEIHMSISSWDQKWLYLVANLKSLAADVVTPAHEAEKKMKEIEEKKKQGEVPEENADQRQNEDEDDDDEEDDEKVGTNAIRDRTLYCTSISRYCFKSGRKTIPPWLVIASSGYGQWASTRGNWDQAENIRSALLSKARAHHQHKFGRPLPRDGLIAGSGFRKSGLLSAYDPSRPEKLGSQPDDTDEEEEETEDDNEEEDEDEEEESKEVKIKGLGRWQDRRNWQLTEFEARRKANLAELARSGTVLPIQE